MADVDRKVFFIEWRKANVKFIKDITLSPSLTRHVIVHIFYVQNVANNNLPRYKPWLFKHPIAKDYKDGVWKAMEDYIKRYKFTDYKTDKRSNKNQLTKGFIISQSNKQRVNKLIDIVAKETSGVTMQLIDSSLTSLLDFMELRCDVCKTAFKEKREVAKHDNDVHSHVCYNQDCIHSNKEQCFASEELLQKHLSNQMRCTFCPGKVFCTRDLLETHLRATHKKCPCTCGEYFGSRKAYLDHFFSRYPTPHSIMSRYPSPVKSAPQKQKKKTTAVKAIKAELQKPDVSDDDPYHDVQEIRHCSPLSDVTVSCTGSPQPTEY